jgi:hypothetical protein
MRVIFFVPLTLIAIFEAFQEEEARWVKNWLHGDNQGDDNYDSNRDPEPSEDDVRAGLSISKVPFSELVKVFPNTAQVSAWWTILNLYLTANNVSSRLTHSWCSRYKTWKLSSMLLWRNWTPGEPDPTCDDDLWDLAKKFDLDLLLRFIVSRLDMDLFIKDLFIRV